MSVISKWINGELRAKRADGKPLTDADREEVKRFVKQPGISADTVIAIFGGGMVVHTEIACGHCGKGYVPAWRRGGKTVEARWPDGRVTLRCHFCGHEIAA